MIEEYLAAFASPSSRSSTRRCATRWRAASGSGPSSAWRRPRRSAPILATRLPAAAALELIQAFSLVHDDLPALDDDEQRRGRPTAHVAFGEAVAILAGDGLLNAAFGLVDRRLAAASAGPRSLAELAAGVAGMIDGQYLDITSGAVPSLDELRRLHRLKTGALIGAAVGCGLHVGGAGEDRQRPYRAYAAELGLLFQIVDDLLDEGADGEPSYVTSVGRERARALAAKAHAAALARLAEADGETAQLAGLADQIASRTA